MTNGKAFSLITMLQCYLLSDPAKAPLTLLTSCCFTRIPRVDEMLNWFSGRSTGAHKPIAKTRDGQKLKAQDWTALGNYQVRDPNDKAPVINPGLALTGGFVRWE